ncbi:rho GTPase-activating protein 20-like isoform X1 [Xyrichtys novacula]|uniref:Rho GTPase-activating protein 20-like isoform X1 n=1 Tax=Xyrichtys novacula TaxID=13765 RepID=A0AAV1HMG7_XYRNO|nr:rho GTPase-activating protein 20-like isoform X1 [Xyrichtys novacula]
MVEAIDGISLTGASSPEDCRTVSQGAFGGWMDNMSPQQDSLGGLQANKRRMKSMTYRRQSAPSLVITKALNRSKTLSRDNFVIPVVPESCPLVQSFLTVPGRSFLLHGHAQLKTGMQTQERHLFLFSDILVIAKAKSANHFKQKAQVRVCEMWLASCLEEVCEGSTFPERSFVMGWPTCNCVALFSSPDLKEWWLSILKSRIKEEKEKEEPKTIPLRVYGKGINTYAVTKMLPVSTSDSTNEVIRLALQQFGIIGNVKDYQLWVISKRDNSLYPLIGHEFPFSIQMSHVRHTMALGGSRDTPASPADRQRAMQVEQMQVYKQCQFILKPRPGETLQTSADVGKKSFKRRRSLITWAFWRGSSYSMNEMSDTAHGRLFCQPLNLICVDGTPPKPIMDMLVFLYHEGSCTRGIFRRPAGARAVRELRDSLDLGVFQLPLTKDNVFIIAGVFKDFLRSIPGSLLCCELHEEWMDVLEEDEEEEEQVQDVQRMVLRLPRENTILLRYLLAMLHGIQGNAQENQMTSFNLSVCIAPSLLWPPGVPCSPEVEGEGTKKVCDLVKFMIDHCQGILGEDPISLFGGPPQRVSSEEMGSDSWLYPLTDSSYDSLENDLDNSSSSSPSLFSRGALKPHQFQGSLDSILTFSDCDQDAELDTQHKLHPPEETRTLTQGPELSCPINNTPTVSTTTNLEWLSLDPRHGQRRRRCSEPAIAYMAKYHPSGGALTGEDEEDEDKEVFSSKQSSQTLTPPTDETRSGRRESGHGLQPAPTSSPLSDEPTKVTTQGGSTTQTPSNPSTVPFTTFSPRSAPPLDRGTSQKASPPKEAPNWGALKDSCSLHPNSWLKKSRRLSRSQQDNLEKEEDASGEGRSEPLHLGTPPREEGKASESGGGILNSSCQPTIKTTCRALKDARGRGRGHVKGQSAQLKQNSFSPPSHHRSTGSLHFPLSPWLHSTDSRKDVQQVGDSDVSDGGVTDQGIVWKPGSPYLSHKKSRSSLSVPKEHKSHSVEEECDTRHQRRVSEPGRQVMDRAFQRERLPSDPGLKVTDVDWQGETSEARFCLTPYATRAVKEYFSSHQGSNPQSSQQVALALVESRREWVKRCSDATAEPDFDQLLFAEESYV